MVRPETLVKRSWCRQWKSEAVVDDPTIVRGDSGDCSQQRSACCWEGRGMGWGRFRVPSDLCGSLRGNVRNLVVLPARDCHLKGCGLPVRVKPCACSLDLGPWLCRSPSVQLAEVQDNFLSSEECEFLKAQVHFDVRGSGGSLKGVKDPKDL